MKVIFPEKILDFMKRHNVQLISKDTIEHYTETIDLFTFASYRRGYSDAMEDLAKYCLLRQHEKEEQDG